MIFRMLNKRPARSSPLRSSPWAGPLGRQRGCLLGQRARMGTRTQTRPIENPMHDLKPLTALILAAALSGTVPALAQVDRIARVDVTVDLAAIQNEKAAAYWGQLEADLEAAIGARVADRLVEEGGEGAEILVDIREVELSNAFERQLNLADAVLVGQVNVNDQTNNPNYDAYELSVSLETARIIPTEGETVILSTDTQDTYKRLVETFADAVVAKLK